MIHTCWREKQAAFLELMLFSQHSSHWALMVQKIGVGPYSAGSTSTLKIIGSSYCLGHEGSGLIHQLKCLASSSEKLSAHPPMPSWYYPRRAGLKGRDTVYPLSCSPWLRDDQGSLCTYLLGPTVSFPWLEQCWDDLYSVETFGIICLSSCTGCYTVSPAEHFEIYNGYFSLFHLTNTSPLLQNRPVLYLLMGSLKEDKYHAFTHFQNEWINPDSGRS